MRRYLIWCAGAAILFTIGVAALVVFADPYRFYGSATMRGVNEIKPRVYQHATIAKARQLQRSEARTLLLGNSRVEIGFDPDSRAFPPEMHPVFNAALAGAGLDTAATLLMQAAEAGTLQTAIVGVDFQDALELPTLADTANGRPALAPAPFQGMWWRDAVKLTLTLDALTDSLITFAGQDRQTGVTMLPNGFNPLNDYKPYVRRAGYHELFTRKNESYARDYQRKPKPDFNDVARLAFFRDLRALLKTAAQLHVDVVLLIHPYHADYLEMLHQLGLWSSFEDWKRAVVRLVAAEREDTGLSVRLVDFSGYHQFAIERVPPPEDTQTDMQWYWEPGHYKSNLGGHMLARLYGNERDFGVDLDERSVEADLDAIRAARGTYMSTRADALTSAPLRAATR
jgi:hypothetical protein